MIRIGLVVACLIAGCGPSAEVPMVPTHAVSQRAAELLCDQAEAGQYRILEPTFQIKADSGSDVTCVTGQ